MRDQQAEIIAFLENPESYPTPAPVTQVETHAARVFLTGDSAYKLKRAVKYPYLDYSTIALRHDCLLRELTLNKILAPDLYRTVWSITREADGRLMFEGAGTVVDWVLVMARFPDEARLDRVAARGGLDRALVCDLADTLSAFHARTPAVPSAGGAMAVRAVLETTLGLLNAMPGRFDPARVRHLDLESHARLRHYADLLDLRSVMGKVRRCHGDLHLENICVVGGKPVLFDRLEFDDRLANIDILYDLAFLVMDLLDKGYPGPANGVFNRYLDRAGESIGLGLMPLFLSMRAAIRSYVLLTQADLASGDQAAAKIAAGGRFFDLAERLLAPAPVRLVAVGGLSGSGKSTLARLLGPHVGRMPGARVLRSDALRKKMLGVGLESPLPSYGYNPGVSQSVYQQMRAEAGAILDAGQSVILDAVAASPEERASFAAMAEKRYMPFTGLWLDAPIDLCHRRIAARLGDVSDATEAVRTAQADYDLGPITWTRLDGSLDEADLLRAALEVIAGGN